MSNMSFYSEADMGLISVTWRSKCTIIKGYLAENRGTCLLFVLGESTLSVQASNISWNVEINMIRIDQNSSVDISKTSFGENNLTDVFSYGLPQNVISVTGGSFLKMKDLVVYHTFILDRGNIFSINKGSVLEASHCQVERSIIELGTVLYCEGKSSTVWTGGHFSRNHIKTGNLIYSEECYFYMVDFQIEFNYLTMNPDTNTIELINNTFQVRT